MGELRYIEMVFHKATFSFQTGNYFQSGNTVVSVNQDVEARWQACAHERI